MMKEMLELAAKQKIEPWIIKRPMSDVNQTVVDMHNSKAKLVIPSILLSLNRQTKKTNSFPFADFFSSSLFPSLHYSQIPIRSLQR